MDRVNRLFFLTLERKIHNRIDIINDRSDLKKANE